MDTSYNFLRTVYSIPSIAWYQMEIRSDVLLQEMLFYCREVAVNELEILDSPDFETIGKQKTEDDRKIAVDEKTRKSKRLLYLFQRDFLGSMLGNQILDNKTIRDAFHFNWEHYYNYTQLYNGSALSNDFLLLLMSCYSLVMIFMVGFILYFAFLQSYQIQKAWVSSILLYIVMDVAILSSLDVIVIHVALPLLIYSDMQEIKEYILQFLRDRINEMNKEEAKGRNDIYSNKVINTEAYRPPSKSLPPNKLQHSESPSRRMLPALSIGTAISSGTSNTQRSINSLEYFFVSHRVAQYMMDDSTVTKMISLFHYQFPIGSFLPKNWLLRSRTLRLDSSFFVPPEKLNRLLLNPRVKASDQIQPISSVFARSEISQANKYQKDSLRKIAGDISRPTILMLSSQGAFLVAEMLLTWFFLKPYVVQDAIVQILNATILLSIIWIHWLFYEINAIFLIIPVGLILFCFMLYALWRGCVSMIYAIRAKYGKSFEFLEKQKKRQRLKEQSVLPFDISDDLVLDVGLNRQPVVKHNPAPYPIDRMMSHASLMSGHILDNVVENDQATPMPSDLDDLHYLQGGSRKIPDKFPDRVDEKPSPLNDAKKRGSIQVVNGEDEDRSSSSDDDEDLDDDDNGYFDDDIDDNYFARSSPPGVQRSNNTKLKPNLPVKPRIIVRNGNQRDNSELDKNMNQIIRGKAERKADESSADSIDNGGTTLYQAREHLTNREDEWRGGRHWQQQRNRLAAVQKLKSNIRQHHIQKSQAESKVDQVQENLNKNGRRISVPESNSSDDDQELNRMRH